MTLTPGVFYKFTIQSRNAIGFSQGSSKLTVMAASIPNPPSNVVTQSGVTSVTVSWSAPVYNGGSVITAYNIVFQQSDGVTYTSSSDCNGASSTVVSSLSCTILFSTLNSSPFNINWGGSIYAQVQAINYVGSSAFSTAGNGAIILTSPSAP